MFLLEAFFQLFVQGWLILQVSAQISPLPRSISWLFTWALFPSSPLSESVLIPFTALSQSVTTVLFDCLVCQLSPSSLLSPGNHIPCWFCLLLIPVPAWWEAWAAQLTCVCSAYECMCNLVRSSTTDSPCWAPSFSDCLRFLTSLYRAHQQVLRTLFVGLPHIKAAGIPHPPCRGNSLL